MNPMDLFNKSTPPQILSQMSALDILLGGLGKQPAARPLSPTLGVPPKKPEPLVQPTVLGTING